MKMILKDFAEYWNTNNDIGAEEITTSDIVDYITSKQGKETIGRKKISLGIESAAVVIKSMPTDQAIQLLKSDISGQPITTVIEGQLIISLIE